MISWSSTEKQLKYIIEHDMATSLTTKVLNQMKLSENVCVTVVATYSVLHYERKKSRQTPASTKASGSQEYWSSLSWGGMWHGSSPTINLINTLRDLKQKNTVNNDWKMAGKGGWTTFYCVICAVTYDTCFPFPSVYLSFKNWCSVLKCTMCNL